VIQRAQLRRQRPAAGDEEVDVAADRLANRREDECVGERPFGVEQDARIRRFVVGPPHVDGPLEDPLFDAGLRRLLPDRVVQLLVDARDARRRRRTD